MSGTASKSPASPRTALVISVLSLLTCCGPLGLLGALLGFQRLNKARQLGQSTLGAVLAIVLGVVSVLNLAGLTAWYRHDQKLKREQANAAEARASDGRTQEALSPEVACALAEGWLLLHETAVPRPVECKGHLRAGALTAQLDQVHLGTDKSFRVCLGRQERWFVLGTTVAACPSTLPEVEATGSREDQEAAIASAAREQMMRAEVDEFRGKLRKVAAAVDGAERGESKCPPLTEASAAVIDAASLPREGKGGRAEKGWGFLTTVEVSSALDPKQSGETRAKAVRASAEASARYLLVLSADDRALPTSGRAGRFNAGFFEGWVSVVDAKEGQVVCETKLEFESSQTISTHKVGLKIGPKVSLGGDLDADFVDHYRDALQRVVDEATAGKLRPAL